MSNYHLYNILKEYVVNDLSLANLFLFKPYKSVHFNNRDIYVINKSEKYDVSVIDWCDKLSNITGLSVEYLPCVTETNDEIIHRLYLLLQNTCPETIIINCQSYKNDFFIKKEKLLKLTESRTFSSTAHCYADRVCAFFHFLRLCILFSILCRCYRVPLVLLDMNGGHRGALWWVLRRIFFTFDNKVLFITGNRVCDKYLPKIKNYIKNNSKLQSDLLK